MDYGEHTYCVSCGVWVCKGEGRGGDREIMGIMWILRIMHMFFSVECV